MSPTNQMEQEEEFKNAMSILKELEKQVLDDTVLAKDQSTVIKSIEVEIDKCIQTLIARREALIKEVTAKFTAKRELMETHQKQSLMAIESCKKILDTGISLYPLSPEAANESWKVSSKLRFTPKAMGSIEIKFQPELHQAIEQHGTVVGNLEEGMKPREAPTVAVHQGGLISPEFQQSLAAWLPNKAFNLLYRASRDGFKAEDFHRMCDDKGPTLTIIRSHPHNYLFGGYTSQSWERSGAYKTAVDAFLFTLTNPHGIPPTKYPVLQPQNSTQCRAQFGPVFGNYDIRVFCTSNTYKNSYTNFPDSFQDSTNKGNATFVGECSFTTNEIEVYSVV